LQGDDAGGHLAALAALTPNDPMFQPGFTSVDTTVRAAVLINPITDLVDEQKLHPGDFGGYFCRKIARLPHKDVEFLKEHSPLYRIHADAVPLLVFHGDRDEFVPFAASQLFADAFREFKATESQFIRIPGGHHAYHLFSSPRSHYQAIGVELWLNHIHCQGKTD
jgi:acetyl esterase/lipase